MSVEGAMAAGFSGQGSLSDLIGKVNNLNDPIPVLNRRPVAYGLVIFLLILADASAILRLYVRFRVTRCPGWDDLFIGLSMLTGSLLAAALLVGFNYHFGEHFLNFAADIDEVINYSKAAYFPNALYPTAITFIKIAILLQFLRVFDVKSRYRTATIVMLYITSLWGLGFSFISWFPAFPVSAFWDLTNQTAIRYGIASLKVNEFTSTLIALNATNMVLDIAMLGIPIPFYLRSGLPWRSRLSLMGLFILGSIINGISLARLALVVDSQGGTYPTLDPSFYGCSQLVLTSLEVSLAIVAASLPVFWPMMKFGWGNIFVTTVITVQHQERNDVVNDSKSDIGLWDTSEEPWKAQAKGRSSANNEKREAWKDEEALVIKPVPDFKTWKAAREDHDSGSLYASTVC